MAIEIIPKTKTEKISLSTIFFYFCIAALLVFLISFLILYILQRELDKELSDLERKIERTVAEKTLEEEMLAAQKKIEDFDLLFNEHRFVANFFNFLEKFTHPKVWFQELKMDSQQLTVDISGQTDNFEILGQQILVLKEQEFVKDINLTKVSISQEGKIKFDFRLTLEPQIFTQLEFLPSEEQSGSSGNQEFLTGSN